jgi:hypothetical protein
MLAIGRSSDSNLPGYWKSVLGNAAFQHRLFVLVIGQVSENCIVALRPPFIPA